MTADPLGRLRARLAGSYDLGPEIGRGGMSVVYRARDLRHDRDVAVKVLRPELAAMLGDDRFLQEIRIETELQHPNILPVLDSGDGEMPYFVLPYLAGPTVRARLQTEGSLPIDEAVRIAVGVAGALGHAHTQGIVHRDVKPENILLGDNGEAVLADFGIARAITAVAGDRLTSEGIAVGTPTYMSPEQAGAGRELDGRSDLYSLGVVLFEMLTGEPPFTGRTPRAVIAKHQAEPPPSLALLRPTVPDHLVRALQRLLAKTPADRFATAEELIRVLQAGALAPVWTTRTQTARRRLVGGVAAVIVIAGTAVAVALRKPAPLDDQRVVVFPALDTGSGPSRANLDVPLAIELALDHARPLRWDHGWDWLPEAIRLNPVRLTAPMAREMARRRGARYYIDGTIQRGSTEVQVVLQLHDVAGDSVLAREGKAAPTGEANVAHLAIQAVTGLLLRWLAPGRHEALASLADRRPAAIALQLRGEQEYRQSRFTAALDLFERSVSEDPTWAYPAVKAAQTASWLNRLDRAVPLIDAALRHPEALPPPYGDFALGLEAYLRGQADSAVARLQRVVTAAPGWDEAHMALGDALYHLIPSIARPDSAAEVEFRLALASDSSFTPALDHLAEILIRRGDRDDGTRLVERLERARPEASWPRRLRLMLDCANGNGSIAAWRTIAQADPLVALGAAKAFSVGARGADCAERLFRAVLTARGVSLGDGWGALLGLHGLLVARGRDAEAIALLDSAQAAGTSQVLSLFILDEVAGAATSSRARDVADLVKSRFGPDADSASAQTRWLLALWSYRRGDAAAVGRIAASLASAARSGDRRTTMIARAVRAWDAAARQDTTGAIAELRALAPTASQDSLMWDLFEPLAPERLLLAELLLARRDWVGAEAIAAGFDHPQPVNYLPFLARGLAIRHAAAVSAGSQAVATSLRQRLEQLGRADLIGPRR